MKNLLINIPIIILILLFSNSSHAQYCKTNLMYSKLVCNDNLKYSGGTEISIGVNGGFGLMSSIQQESGIALGMFAEIQMQTFSIVPQANYWKTDNQSNFELAGLARLKFKTSSIEPYIDGGIGFNIYQSKFSSSNSITKLGIDLGGGLDNIAVGSNFSIFADAKYKIIVNEDEIGDPSKNNSYKSNVKGYVITAGIKFYFK